MIRYLFLFFFWVVKYLTLNELTLLSADFDAMR